MLDGGQLGFADIDLACLYSYWLIRLLVRGYELDQDPGKQARVLMDRVATCWMHAEAIGARSIRTWLDSLVKRIDNGDESVSGKSMNALCTLVANFVTGRDVAALERSGWAPIDVYAPVVKRTLTPECYDTLAVYHQEGVDGDDFPPFHSYPYRIAPLELLAVAKHTGIPSVSEHAC